MSPAWRRAELPVVAALALVTLVAALLVPTYPNYDTYFHLVWGREVLHGLHGTAPDFEAYAAPTEHPLWIAICAVVGLVGTDADRVMVVLCVLSLVVLAWGAFRLGLACFGPWPALAGAFFVGSSFSFLLFAARGYLDVPFLALVVWAAALEAQRPKRGTLVMALLAVAGLLRPEAWVLAGLYWLWCGPRRLGLLALAAAAPLLWCLLDFLVTGDPLYSLHATSELADELNRSRGIGAVPGSFVSFVSAAARPPVVLAALAAVVLLWKLKAGRALHVPAALFAAGVITFVGTGVAGLSVLPRYLTIPVVAVCVVAGFGVLGFTTLDPGRLRTLWSRAAVGALVVGLAFVGVKASSFGKLTGELRFLRTSHEDVVALLDDPRVRASWRCGVLTFPNYRLVPDTRWRLHPAPGPVLARSQADPSATGVAIVVTGGKELRRFGYAAGVPHATNRPPAGFRRLTSRGRFAAYGRC
jgi:hypothetical protein